MERKRKEWEHARREMITKGSESLHHYLYVLQITNVTYGTNLPSVDTAIMRLRLAYYWQISGGLGQSCQL